MIADSVNPIAITRNDWQKVATEAKVNFIEIELICSNILEHQNRIESRKSDIQGHKLPNWQEVLNRKYDPWKTKSITIDTSQYSVEKAVEIILDLINIHS